MYPPTRKGPVAGLNEPRAAQLKQAWKRREIAMPMDVIKAAKTQVFSTTLNFYTEFLTSPLSPVVRLNFADLFMKAILPRQRRSQYGRWSLDW